MQDPGEPDGLIRQVCRRAPGHGVVVAEEGRPVRRLRQFLASYGLLLAESTLVTVLTRISLLLVPVIECIEEQNREAVAWNVHESH